MRFQGVTPVYGMGYCSYAIAVYFFCTVSVNCFTRTSICKSIAQLCLNCKAIFHLYVWIKKTSKTIVSLYIFSPCGYTYDFVMQHLHNTGFCNNLRHSCFSSTYKTRFRLLEWTLGSINKVFSELQIVTYVTCTIVPFSLSLCTYMYMSVIHSWMWVAMCKYAYIKFRTG